MRRSRRGPIEMERLDLDAGWEALSGFPEGIDVKILADDLNETNKTGGRTRLVRFSSGASTTAPLIHDYWEEVFLLSGQLSAIGGEGESASGLTFSLRPPGTPHGPFSSEAGCILLEVQYYAVTDA